MRNCVAMGKALPAQESSLCAIFLITFMQILLWQECTSVFVRMCHFEMTADPTAPLGSWGTWTEVADPCSCQSCNNSSNTERGLRGADWSCRTTSVLEETSIEPPSPDVWIYVCIYKNIWTDSIIAVRKVATAEQCHFMSSLERHRRLIPDLQWRAPAARTMTAKGVLLFTPHTFNPKGRKCNFSPLL